MNMPAKETFGAQPAIELLRQYFDHSHWYDLEGTRKIFLLDILVIAAMGLPGGSRHDICQRCLRHFSVYCMNPFSEDSMIRIFTNILLISFKKNGFAADAVASVTSIIGATMEIYEGAIRNLLPTPAKSHYIYNLRDFSRVIQGCVLLKKDSVDTKKVFIKIWVHEALRVFYDRLVDAIDRAWLYNKLRCCVQEHFKESFDASLDSLPMEKGVLVRLAAQGGNRNLDISALSVFSFFINRCKQKMHLILCFSPIGMTFRRRLRLYPSLVNCCTIDWFTVSIIYFIYFFSIFFKAAAEDFFLQEGRKVYITSAAYLELIHSFSELTNVKQSEILEAKLRYIGGLDKLQFAAEQVCPAFDELYLVRNKHSNAIAALNTLKPTDITLVKSMKNPPDAIKLVMAAVCVMKNVKPDRISDPSTGRMVNDYWGPSKRVLGDMYFLQSLKDFDKDNIAPPIMKKIRTEYLPNKDFKPNVVAKASSAAEGLCKWVIAMDMYDKVAKEVAPKKAKLEIAESEYNATKTLLEEKRTQLRTLEDQLANLHQKLNEANQRKQALEDDVTLCANKLHRAEKLIGK
ncbi:hypothetical protein C0J52_02087 [Blattella germanica]|nr:hypothetical protein C0J52_02087 [Blattella germanica]